MTSTTSYSASVSYALSSGEGSKTIYAWYKDAAGNVSSPANATITLDTTVPTVTISSPTSSLTYTAASNTITLSGSASDSSSGISNVTWSNNKGGNGTATGTASWTVSSISLSSGDNIITVTAKDGAGNSGTDIITVTYSTVTTVSAPTVSTGSASSVTTSTATLSGTVNANGGTATAWFQYGTTSGSYGNTSSTQTVTGSSNTTVSLSISGLSSNTKYYYRMAASNSGGVSYGTEASFSTTSSSATPTPTPTPSTSETTVPGGSISINSGASYTNSVAVTLSLSATDSVGVTGYYISDSSSTPSSSASGWTSVTSTTSYSGSVSYSLSSGDGSKTVYIWYKDAAGNVSSTASDTITLDTIVPAVTISSPTSDATYTATSSTISLGGSASDSTSGVKEVTWSSSRGASGTVRGTTSWTVSNISLSNGDTTITVTAKDNAGNTATDTITVTSGTSYKSKVIFHAHFDSDTPGTSPVSDLPGPPEGDSIKLNEPAGYIMVQSAIGDLKNQPAEVVMTGGIGGVNLLGTVAGKPPEEGIYYVKWKGLVQSETWTSVFAPMVIRDSSSFILASISYRNNGILDFNDLFRSSGIGVSWTANVSQEFEFTIDLDNKSISLSIDGVPVSSCQNMSYYETKASNIAHMNFEVGLTTSQAYAIDDMKIWTNVSDVNPTPSPSPTPTGKGVIFGQVIYAVDDYDGSPLNGVVVSIKRGDGGFSDSTTTVSNGEFRFDNLEAGDYTLIFEKEGYSTSATEISLGEGESRGVLVELSPTTPSEEKGVIFGVVNDEDDEPLKGVVVSIEGKSFSDSTKTDDDGYYEFRDIDAGEYVLTYEKDGYQTQTANVTLEEGGAEEADAVTMELIVKGTISGYVYSLRGDPLENVRLKLSGIKTRVKDTASSDADGFFEFTDLEADIYVIFSKKKGYKRGKETVELEEGTDEEIEITLRKTSSRRILITEE